MKKGVKISCFVALAILLTFGVYKVLSFKDTMGLVGSSVTQLSYTEDNKIDVAFVGSSHVYAGVSPATLWNEFGISAFNMSVSSMDMFSCYYYTKHLLKTQSPKYVFVDLYSFTFLEHLVTENVYRNMLGMPLSSESYHLIDDYFTANGKKDERLSYILRWPIIHTRYKEVTYNDFMDVDFARYGRGERLVFENTGVIDVTDIAKYGVAELDDNRLKVLGDLKKLADDNNFELVLCVIPYTVGPEGGVYINAVEKYANENGIKFINFNLLMDEMGIDPVEDSSDSLHLNTVGAEKLSRWVGNYLLEKGIDTHWGEDGYELWDLDYAYLAHRRSVDFLAKEYNLGDREGFFRTLNAIPGISYIVTVDEEEVSDQTIESLEMLGIDFVEAESGGVWVKARGTEIKHAQLTDGIAEYTDIDEITTAKVLRNGDEVEITIGNNNGHVGIGGTNIAVYDNINHKFVNCYFWGN